MLGIIGEYEVSLDSKFRVTLPVSLRKQLIVDDNTVVYLNRSMDLQCINLYTAHEWDKIINNLCQLSLFNPKVDKLKRLMLAGAAMIELDASGRILIPRTLVNALKLNKEIMIIGQLNKLEIWDKVAYYNYLEQNSGDLADLANELFGNNLGI